MNRSDCAAELTQKPSPFVLQLSVGDENALSGSQAAKLGLIERVAARASFGVDKRKISVRSQSEAKHKTETASIAGVWR